MGKRTEIYKNPEPEIPALTRTGQRPRFLLYRQEQKKKRDIQVTRLAQKLRRLAPQLEDASFWPVLLSFSRITLLSERLYAELRKREKLVSPTGATPSVLDGFRRMVSEQRMLAFELGLVPRSKEGLAKETTTILDLDTLRNQANGDNDKKRLERPSRVLRKNVRSEPVGDAEEDPMGD
jgi:hypothetical protein